MVVGFVVQFKLLFMRLWVAMSLLCASGQWVIPDRAWCEPFCNPEQEEVCATSLVPNKTNVSPAKQTNPESPAKQTNPESPQINNNSPKATSVIQVIKQGEENVVKLEWLLYISIFLLAVNLYRSQQLEYKISGNGLSWLVKPLFRKEEKNINDNSEFDQISEIIKAVNKDIEKIRQELSQLMSSIEQANAKVVRDEDNFKRLTSHGISMLTEEVNKLENKFNEFNQAQNRDVVKLREFDKLGKKQDDDYIYLNQTIDSLLLSVSKLSQESQEKFALLDKLSQFVDRFTPVLAHIEATLQQKQKRTQSPPWENGAGTTPVLSNNETNVAVNAPKKVQQSDMPRSIVQMVEIFNTNAATFNHNYKSYSVTVAEQEKSAVGRFQGEKQQIYFETHNAGKFIAVIDNPNDLNSNVYWLVPKPDSRPTEFNQELWNMLFGYDGQSFTRYTLVLPAKISSVEERKRFVLECVGEIDFS